MRNLFFLDALLPDGWANDVLVTIDEAGLIQSVTSKSACPAEADRIEGHTIAGIANLHSHAHQRAIAGMGERSSNNIDSFWSWRTAMYRALDRMQPEALEAVATQLYVEMVKAGFTTVAEFHYLHHDRNGRPYDDPAEMSHRLIAAARTAGLSITLLPVLYAASGFGPQPPTDDQKRFLHDVDSYVQLMESLQATYGKAADVRLGIAPHSLRAVPVAMLKEVVAAFPTSPIHIHIAEQRQEVEDCLAHTGLRPIEWLYQNLPVNERWCLIHATHANVSEVTTMAASGAVVGLCPTTEANLGDGLFYCEDYLEQGGWLGVGSDSHISVSPVEELRWMEYGRRLIRERRTVLAGGPQRSTARTLIAVAQRGGAQACGFTGGAIAPGHRADFVTINNDHPLTFNRSGDALLDSWIFSGNVPLVQSVIVGGQTVVSAGEHPQEHIVAQRFKQTLGSLFS